MPTVPEFPVVNDYLIWDNREFVSFISHANAGDTTYALTAPPDGKGNAKQRPVRSNEIMKSGGAYIKGDCKWFIPKVLLPAGLLATPPKIADRVKDAANVEWTVLDANLEVWESIWELTCRALSIQNQLQDTIDIQRPTITFNASGAKVLTFPPAGGTTPYAALVSRVQPQRAAMGIQSRDLRGVGTKFDIPIASEVVLTADDRIKTVTCKALGVGVLLAITGYRESQRVDVLPVIEAEAVP